MPVSPHTPNKGMQGLTLHTLVDDVLNEPILFKEGHDIAFDDIKKYLRELVISVLGIHIWRFN